MRSTLVCESQQVAVREVVITNTHGLHLRPVMKFVDIANQYTSEIRVDKGEGSEPVDGKSPMAMMVLEAPKGTRLRIHAAGVDARETVEALIRLVESKFDEE